MSTISPGDPLEVRVRDRERERSRELRFVELDFGLGIAGPKNKVAELVNLAIGARTGMDDSGGGDMFENAEGRDCVLRLVAPLTLRRGSGDPASEGDSGDSGEFDPARERISCKEGNEIGPAVRSALALALAMST